MQERNDSLAKATSRSGPLAGALPSPGFDAEGAANQLIARMEQVPTSRWFVISRVVMGSATFFDALNALSIAFVLPILVPLWHITPPEIGILIGASYVGQIIGAFAFSWGAERYGRIPCAAAATAIYAVLSLACAAAWSFNVLLLFRFVQGIGVGGEMPVAATYISELSKTHGRGRFFLLYEMIFPIGLMATGQAGAWLVPLIGWQIMFLIGGIPGLVVAVTLLRLPESPRWLIGKGRLAAAEAVVRRFEAASGNAGAAIAAEPAATLPAQIEVPSRARGKWSELLSPAYRSRTLIAWVLWACAFLVANGLNNWMPTLYTTVYHLALPQALRAASMTNVAQVCLVLICALVIDRTGRKYWMMGAFGLGAVTLALLGLGGAQEVSWFIVLSTISYGLIGSIAAVVYLYTPEIYPTRMRAVGTGVATSWLRIASAIGPTLIGFMLGKGGGVDSVFLMFAVVAIVGLIAATRMIETRNLRLEEISR